MESKTRQNSKFRLVLWVMLLFATLTASAQQVKVTGTVTDPGGEPLVGVSVKAGSTGAITDIDGKYSVEVASSGTISFSYVGFETIMEKVNGRKTINVTLKEKNDVLNEVVVIGYGTMDKKELTSAISHVGEKDFLTISSLDPSMMIQGKVAGVNVVSSSGAPGGAATIRIRGGSSLNAKNDPLIVIDGLALDNDGLEGSPNALTLVNPNDIESFTVLKDASATAIYGSRASNGVIIITTKKGRKNTRPHVSYNGNVSVSNNTKYLEVLNAQEFIDLVRRRTGLTDDAA